MNGRTARDLHLAAVSVGSPSLRQTVKQLKRAWRLVPWHRRHALRELLRQGELGAIIDVARERVRG